MPCSQPIPAWRPPTGALVLKADAATRARSSYYELRCGKCTDCRRAQAQAWALRCTLELERHQASSFTTLTYDDANIPRLPNGRPTLRKHDLQLFLKRLRSQLARSDAARTIRFFASGEYGETTRRPHYHAILYGLAAHEDAIINATWQHGHAKTMAVTAAGVRYVAGYTAKKYGETNKNDIEQVDPETGELVTWEAPFINMSRRPGIGAHARQHTHSWRDYAIMDGYKLAVPRYYHEAWKKQATEEQISEKIKQYKDKIQKQRPTTEQELNARELIARARQSIQAARRAI